MNETIDTLEFKNVLTDDLKYLFSLFEKYSYQIRIAGGAVRDLLMGKLPNDIDFATTATPDQMKELFTKENIRMLKTNGEKHGTITVRLNEKENYEITTLRIDVITDGRHAEVEFTKDWKLDANRRDLTVNSIFLTNEGEVIDFFDGYNDIKLKRIRFVGQAAQRIQEDYLRILRYFRFYGRVCVDENSHDLESLSAIKEHSSGLNGIAGERIWVEFKRIIVGKFADSLMRHIVDTKVHVNIGFHEVCDLDEFTRIYKNNLNDLPMPITMICSLFKNPKQFEKLLKRLKFSNDEKKLAEFIFKFRHLESEKPSEDIEISLKPFKDILVDNIKDLKKMEKMKDLLKYINKLEYIRCLEVWEIPIFPITGEHLTAKNIPKGPLYSKILNILKTVWKNDLNFNTDKDSVQILLDKCDEMIV